MFFPFPRYMLTILLFLNMYHYFVATAKPETIQLLVFVNLL